MNKKLECKIVQDLLPMYIDKITDIDVNNFIEEHLKNCDECMEIYKDMGENIDIERIEERKKIDSLKKYKKIQKIKILMIIIILFTILSGLYWFHVNYHFEIDEEGEMKIVKSTVDYGRTDLKFIIYEVYRTDIENGEDGKIYSKIFLTIQDEKVISARIIEKGFKNLEETYNIIVKSKMQIYGNVQINNDILIYNDNYITGKKLDFVTNVINKKYIVINYIKM